MLGKLLSLGSNRFSIGERRTAMEPQRCLRRHLLGFWRADVEFSERIRGILSEVKVYDPATWVLEIFHVEPAVQRRRHGCAGARRRSLVRFKPCVKLEMCCSCIFYIKYLAIFIFYPPYYKTQYTRTCTRANGLAARKVALLALTTRR